MTSLSRQTPEFYARERKLSVVNVNLSRFNYLRGGDLKRLERARSPSRERRSDLPRACMTRSRAPPVTRQYGVNRRAKILIA